MKLTIKVARGFDGRWIAEASELAWVVGYGVTQEEAICKVEQLAVEEVAERIARGDLAESAFNLAFEVIMPARTKFRNTVPAYSAGTW